MPAKGEKVYLLERRHALVLSLLVSFVVIFGVACILAYQSYSKSILATIRSNETKTTLLAKLILEHQRAAVGVLQSYADQPMFVDSVKRRDFGGALKHLVDLVKSNPEMEWPFISNPDSTVWVNHPVDRQVWHKDLSFRDWYKGVSKEWKPYISSVYKLMVGEKDLAVAICVPVFDEQGKVIGILSTAQSTAFFQKTIGEVGLNLDAKISLVDQEGHIIYSNAFPYTKEVTGYPPLGFVEKALRGEKGDFEVRDTANQDSVKYVSFAPVEGIGWSVIVEKARSEVFRSEIPSLAVIGVIALLVFSLSVLFLVHLRQRHRQIKDLERLNEELDSRVRERTAEIEAREQALRVSEERYRMAIQASNDAIYDLNLKVGTVHWNEMYASSLGRPPETANSWQWWVDHVHPLDRDRAAGGLRAAVDGEANNWACEYRFMRTDGTWADIYDRACIARDAAGKAWRVVGAMQDLTERKQAEEALSQRTRELQQLTETLEARVKERTAELVDLSSRLVTAQEEERKRVSYDLHDHVWQTLLAIRAEVDTLLSDCNPTDPKVAQDRGKKVKGAILDMVGEIRSMQGDLWPYVLDDIGILATLDWYCREFERKHPGLTVDTCIELGETEVLSPVKIVIYRITQEVLNNVAKHSHAGHVTLRLIKKNHEMEFSVEDNGIGFDPEETIAQRAPWGGLGLLNIKARTDLSGGSFAVESVMGKGTTVRATWPV